MFSEPVRLLRSHQTSDGQPALSVSRTMPSPSGRHRWIDASRGHVRTEIILRIDEDSILSGARELGLRPVGNGLSVLNVTTESRPDDEQRERQRQHSFRKELTALREVLITFGPQTLDPNEWLRSELEWLEAYHRVSLRSLAYLCNETAARQLALHQRQEASELSEIAEHCGDLCEDSTVDEFTGLEAYMLMYLVVRTLRADQFLRTRELLRQVRGKSALWHHEYGVPERFQGL